MMCNEQSVVTISKFVDNFAGMWHLDRVSSGVSGTPVSYSLHTTERYNGGYRMQLTFESITAAFTWAEAHGLELLDDDGSGCCGGCSGGTDQ